MPKSSLFPLRSLLTAATAALALLAAPLGAQEDDAATGTAPEPLELFAITAGMSTAEFKIKEAEVTAGEVQGEPAVIITFQPSEKFPDIQFPVPGSGEWDLSQYGAVAVDITNLGTEEAGVSLRLDNPEPISKKAWNQGGEKIPPGETRTVKVSFGKMPNGKAGYPLDPAKVSAIHIFVARPAAEIKVAARNLRAVDAPSGNAAVAEEAGPQGAMKAPANPPAEPLLFDFEGEKALANVGGLDSTRSLEQVNGSQAVKVVTGTTNPYPNVTFKPAQGPWNLAKYAEIHFDVTNLGEESVQFGARVDNAGATGRSLSNSGGISLDPGETGTLEVEMDRFFAMELREKLKGMHITPWGKRGGMGGQIDPGNITQMNVFVSKQHRPVAFAVDNIRAVGSYTEPTVPEPFFPFVDKYGQYLHQDWPGKVKADADLAAVREAEAKSIADFPRPEDWNKYGGWAKGPQLEKRPNFYTAKHEGKWYLVDPEGNLFFSMGMDVVKAGGQTPIEGRDGWFKDAPWEAEEGFDKFLGTGKSVRGDYGGTEPKTYDFYSANLLRKYGAEYEQQWLDLIPKRLMNWGFNTIGNWSEPKLLKQAGIPYTHWVHYWPPTKLPRQPGTRNQVPDPFDPGLPEAIRKGTDKMLKGTIEDPLCIGYFVDNELSWGNESYLARGIVKATPALHAKQELAKNLQAKYGEVAKLNAAWGSSHADWDAFLKGDYLPETKAGEADLTEFNEKLVRKYFEVVAAVMKQVAPHKLYLGCRFAENNPQVIRASAEYCDVVSFNIYRETVEQWRPGADIDKPVIIGEFHFGASDRGVFGKGLRGAKTTEERTERFLRYVTGAAKNPLIIGAHYFALTDEPTSGRTLEGENHGFGFLTITDTPYAEMIEASRQAATRLYDARSGSKLTLAP